MDLKANDAGKIKKLCSICGTMLAPRPSHLVRHCQRQHHGSNNGFLKVGASPTVPKYSNLTAHLEDGSIALELNPLVQYKNVGRPLTAILAKEAIIESVEEPLLSSRDYEDEQESTAMDTDDHSLARI